MARTAKLSKAEITDKLTPVFENSGYDGASLKTLAAAAALSKASLYHHFPGGKQEMALHVLARAGIRLQKHILAPLLSPAASTMQLIESLEGTAVYYNAAIPVCLMNSLLLGEGVRLFGPAIQQTVSRWQTALEQAFIRAGENRAEAKAWAAYALQRIQGALILCRVTQTRTPLEACLAELSTDVTAAAG